MTSSLAFSEAAGFGDWSSDPALPRSRPSRRRRRSRSPLRILLRRYRSRATTDQNLQTARVLGNGKGVTAGLEAMFTDSKWNRASSPRNNFLGPEDETVESGSKPTERPRPRGRKKGDQMKKRKKKEEPDYGTLQKAFDDFRELVLQGEPFKIDLARRNMYVGEHSSGRSKT